MACLDNKNGAIERYLQEEGATAYKGKYERSWARKMTNFREHQILLRLLREVDQGIRLLNVASGAGRFSKLILSKVGGAVFADLSLPMLRISRESVFQPSKSLLFVAANVMKLPFPDKSFDLVMAVRLLHHIQNDSECQACISELLRVSRRWGLVTFADSLSFKGLHRRFRQRWFGRKRGEAMLDRQDLTTIAASFGYRPIRFVPISRWFSTQTYVLLERRHG
jgi:ubiquinone/menaquinone biosynthesis C-methylase UbiE